MENSNDLYFLIKWIVAWVSGSVTFLFAINKIVDGYFSFRAKQLDKRIGELIEEKVEPQITKLSDSIDSLKVTIAKLTDKM